MLPGKVNYKSFVRNDTINARRFTLTQTVNSITTPISLTGADIKSFFTDRRKTSKLMLIGDGITLIDAPNGVFEIDSFSLDVPGTYDYDVDILFPNGVRRTYISGQIVIVEDVTK